jgi:hypothetical protein
MGMPYVIARVSIRVDLTMQIYASFILFILRLVEFAVQGCRGCRDWSSESSGGVLGGCRNFIFEERQSRSHRD